jgi:hypothetical protein
MNSKNKNIHPFTKLQDIDKMIDNKLNSLPHELDEMLFREK